MKLASLLSETRNVNTMDLDTLSTLEMVSCFNREDAKVAGAVKLTLPAVALAVDAAAQALIAGGRIIYIGAGTSGRLGLLDAAECPPTFGVSPDKVIGLIAGGVDALTKAIEGAEDKAELGVNDLRGIRLTANDMVIGLAASGRTPYVIGALRYARQLGCITAAISCNTASLVAREAKIVISPLVGPEALTGSTRLKAGTAQKLILNMISTGAMVKYGKVYQNLMVDMRATNIKLRERANLMVVEATGCSYEDAKAALSQCENEVKTAILMVLTEISAEEAAERLHTHRGYLRAALAAQ